MKKSYIFILLGFYSILGQAQNVGIGTLTPLVPLHINSSTNAYEVLRLQSANAQGSVLSIWNNSERKGFLGIVDNENDFKLGTYYTGGRIQFVTETFDVAMTILPGGNVGIGTETPSSILEVNGAITFQTYNGAGTEGALRYNGGAFEWHDGNAWQAFSGGGGSSTWSENAFGVYFSDSNKRTYVGLNTESTPLKFGVFNTDFLETSRIYHKPAVTGTEAYAQNIIADAPVAMDYDNYGSKIEILQNGSGAKYGISNKVTQNLSTSSAAYGIFNNVRTLGGSSYAYAARNFVNTATSGNSYGSHNYILGNGTGGKYGVYSFVTGGGTKYGLYAKADGSGTKYGVYAEATGGSSYALYASNSSLAGGGYAGYFNGRIFGNNDVAIGVSAPNPTRFFVQGDTGQDIFRVRTVGGSTKLMVNEAGQVLINTPTESATGYALNVNGKIIAEELRIEWSADWPDYVFANDYQLKTLEEVAKHIKAKKHLPGIPSAAKVKENGLMVGDMQKRMMEKIEELTLYVIDLNENVKELKKENSKLKTRIEELEK